MFILTVRLWDSVRFFPVWPPGNLVLSLLSVCLCLYSWRTRYKSWPKRAWRQLLQTIQSRVRWTEIGRKQLEQLDAIGQQLDANKANEVLLQNFNQQLLVSYSINHLVYHTDAFTLDAYFTQHTISYHTILYHTIPSCQYTMWIWIIYS